MKEVEIIEIWMPVKEGGEAFSMEKGNLKLVAFLANGYPLKLEKDFMLEKGYISQAEYENLKGTQSTPSLEK